MKSTTIQKITIYPFNIKLKSPFVIALETITHAHNILIHIQCGDPDLSGWGEASPYQTIQGEMQATQILVAKTLAATWLNKDAIELEERIKDLDTCILGNKSIKSAFEMALHDIVAKSHDLPLYKFLNGKLKTVRTDMTVGIDLPEKMADSTKQFMNQGFSEIKIKLGKNPEEDIERIKQIRNACGYSISLRIDANQGWSVTQANQVLKEINKYKIDHCEQPVHAKNYAGMKRVQEQSPIAIMADESLFDAYDAALLIQLGACRQFNIKLGKSGGIAEAHKIATMASVAGIKCQVGCFSESRLGITALMHFALAHDIIQYFDMDSPLMLEDDPIQGGAAYRNTNELYISDEPGLGLDIDPVFLQKLEGIVAR